MDWAGEGCQKQSQELINESPALLPARHSRAWEITSPAAPLASRPSFTAVCASLSVCSAVDAPVCLCPSGRHKIAVSLPVEEVAQFSCLWSCRTEASPGGVLPLGQAPSCLWSLLLIDRVGC